MSRETSKHFTIKVLPGPKVLLTKIDRRRKDSVSPVQNDITEEFVDALVEYSKQYCYANRTHIVGIRHSITKDEILDIIVKDVPFEKDFQAVVPNYPLSDEELLLVRNYEKRTGFELIKGEEITDRKSFVRILHHNLDWFENWHIEQKQMIQSELYGLSYYLEAREE